MESGTSGGDAVICEGYAVMHNLSMNVSLQMNLPTPHPALSPLRGEGEESACEGFMGSKHETSIRRILSRKHRIHSGTCKK